MFLISCFFFSSRRRHTRLVSDWSSDVCSSDLHQFRIDRRAPHRRIVRCKFAAKPGQIESSIDLPHQMIFRNRVAKSKLVEQLTLVTLQTAHHGSTSPRFASTKRNHASRPLSTDFCNKIGTEQTCCSDRFVSVAEVRTDLAREVARGSMMTKADIGT